MLDPRIQDFDPSVDMTIEVDGLDWKVENQIELPAMWLVAPYLMPNLEDDETTYVFGLLDSVVAIIGVDEDFNDF